MNKANEIEVHVKLKQMNENDISWLAYFCCLQLNGSTMRYLIRQMPELCSVRGFFMSKLVIEKTFTYNNRKFLIITDCTENENIDDSIELIEEIQSIGKPLKHYMESDGVLNKTEPIVFACKDEKGEMEISMQYEGLPLEPLLTFLEVVCRKWKVCRGLKTGL